MTGPGGRTDPAQPSRALVSGHHAQRAAADLPSSGQAIPLVSLSTDKTVHKTAMKTGSPTCPALIHPTVIALAVMLGYAIGQREADILELTIPQWVALPEHKMQPEDYTVLAAAATRARRFTSLYTTSASTCSTTSMSQLVLRLPHTVVVRPTIMQDVMPVNAAK